MAPEDKDSPGQGQVGHKDLPSRTAMAVVDGRQAVVTSLGPDGPWGCAHTCPDTLRLSAGTHRGTPDQEGLEAGSGPVVAMDRELPPMAKHRDTERVLAQATSTFQTRGEQSCSFTGSTIPGESMRP